MILEKNSDFPLAGTCPGRRPGILMMGYGIFRGEMAVVFTKAVNICMECIGIG